ncbi:MAG: glycine--tRNA ligase subunit beta [Gammaproteobacteria bacterium]
MADTQAFLVEIGTEELPPKSLANLAKAFHHGILGGLEDARLLHPTTPEDGERYFSPRRLAVQIHAVLVRQPDLIEDRLGPAVGAAFDGEGRPTKAAEGFAKSCGVTVGQLERRATEKGERLAYTRKTKGKTAAELVPQIVSEALAKLPIPKRMRWGTGQAEFIRPVHWVLMLLGDRPLKAEILGVPAGNKTYGHRFHHPAAITLKRPADYRRTLAITGKVLVEDRQGTLAKKIGTLVTQAAKRARGKAQLDQTLLEEVAALLEWPMPVTGNFDKKFLTLPDEVIVAVLETQQRCFPLRGAKGKLLPHFVAISNIRSRKPAEVRRGNERVIVPRLTDAMFFWNVDRKMRLDARIPELDRVVFQKELGSYGDKSRRVAKLAVQITQQIGGAPQLAERAARLAKCDLVTGMVSEFPELQGVMGGYYAEHDGEPSEVAVAIAEQYQPRFAGDKLPKTKTGQALAIADKLDTIVGIFASGGKPTGEKDPFGLRRAALGGLRILIERKLDLDLWQLIMTALNNQPLQLDVPATVITRTDVFNFMIERLRTYYVDSGMRSDVFAAIRAQQPHRPLDFHHRVQAVNAFLALPQAASLAVANKRIANILRQAGRRQQVEVLAAKFNMPEEHALHEKILALRQDIAPLLEKGDYAETLRRLAALRTPVDKFFEAVLVMDTDPGVRENRLALLASLSALFLHTADLSLIQVE